MIVARAPFRISFVGGGTDLPEFYRLHPGRVVATTIDKYMYVVLNRTRMIPKISARYNVAETVNHPNELKHTRIKAALLDLGITKGIEIASFAALPEKTGLGSSSSFSVALLKALYAYLKCGIDTRAAAEAASRLEIELLGEPIGKQDQYAAAFGGLNVFQFNPDHSVTVKPVLIDFKKRLLLEDHTLVLFTGITRASATVLTEQRANIKNNFETLAKMADSVGKFRDFLLEGDLKSMGEMLHEGWLQKKTLASNVSNTGIDDLYNVGINNGAWGGKILGAGGGGCLLFIVPPSRRGAVIAGVTELALKHRLRDFQEIPVKFTQSGTEILFNDDYDE